MKKQRRPKLNKAVHTGKLVEKLLQGLGYDKRLNQYKALIIWDEVVGPQISAHTKPIGIREGILEVNVDQPVWMQQLQLMKPKILARLNTELGEKQIKDIYLKRGKLRPPSNPPSRQQSSWEDTPLDHKDKDKISKLLADVKDKELRNEMEDFLSKQMRLIKTGPGKPE